MRALLPLWLLFSLIAALMAYLITYDEYRRHFPERRRAISESVRTAGVTLVIFLALGVALGPIVARLAR